MSKKDRETNRAARAAAVRQQQVSRERRRRIMIVAAILVVLAAIVATGVLLGTGNSKDSSATGDGSIRAESPALALGTDPKATKVVVYEDFLCPYCRELEAATRTKLRAAAARGDASVEYRPFHLLPDEYSSLALSAWGTVLQKGTPQQALKFHDLLFENQPYENAATKPDINDLITLAKEAGVTDSNVLDAMKQSDQPFMDSADNAARQAGIQATPTVLIDGKPVAGSPTQMAASINQQLAK